MELKNRSFQYGKYRFRTIACMPRLKARGRYQPSVSYVLGPFSQNLSIALTEIPWTTRCGACSSNASTIAGFATSATWNSVSRSGVASTRKSLTEQFDSGMFDYAHVSVQMAATLSTNCHLCITVCTVVQNCCKGRSKKYRKWHFSGCCRRETP